MPGLGFSLVWLQATKLFCPSVPCLWPLISVSLLFFLQQGDRLIYPYHSLGSCSPNATFQAQRKDNPKYKLAIASLHLPLLLSQQEDTNQRSSGHLWGNFVCHNTWEGAIVANGWGSRDAGGSAVHEADPRMWVLASQCPKEHALCEIFIWNYLHLEQNSILRINTTLFCSALINTEFSGIITGHGTNSALLKHRVVTAHFRRLCHQWQWRLLLEPPMKPGLIGLHLHLWWCPW